MEITATYPDNIAITVSVDNWDAERVVKALFELGVVSVTIGDD